jgi:hypothetical protein
MLIRCDATKRSPTCGNTSTALTSTPVADHCPKYVIQKLRGFFLDEIGQLTVDSELGEPEVAWADEGGRCEQGVSEAGQATT